MDVYYDGIIYSLQKIGGITRYFNELIPGTNRTDNQIKVFLHNSLYSFPLSEIISSEYISSLKTIYKNKFLKYVLHPLDHYCTEQFLKKKNIQNGIFHSTYFTYYKNLKIPQIITLHDLIYEKVYSNYSTLQKIFLAQKRKILQQTDHIICISETTAQDVEEYYGIDKNKLSVIHHGISTVFNVPHADISQFFLKDKNITLPYILYVGTRCGYKNFNRFIEAFSLWKEKINYQVVIVGGGKITQEEQKLFSKLKVENKILHFENVWDKDLVSFYQNATAFIYPSLYEGFGLPLLEAMISGTCTLCSDIPVFREIGQDIPIYFNPHDNSSIIAALEKIPYESKNKGKIPRGIVRAREFAWKKTINKTLEVYKNLIT